MIDIPPGKYFVSHSYCDRALKPGFNRLYRADGSIDCAHITNSKEERTPINQAVDPENDPIEQLRTLIPQGVQLKIFDPISEENISRNQFVSNNLIETILECDGLIFLADGRSRNSFWVTFERDYALRAKKRVYSFNASNQHLAHFTETPLNLAIYPSIARPMQHSAQSLIEYMSTERFFDLWIDAYTGELGNFADWLEQGMDKHIQVGGYVVSFFDEDRVPSHAYARNEMSVAYKRNRLIVANLGLSNVQTYPSELVVNIVDQHGVNNNRIDDLIVRLYGLIFKNQFLNLSFE